MIRPASLLALLALASCSTNHQGAATSPADGAPVSSTPALPAPLGAAPSSAPEPPARASAPAPSLSASASAPAPSLSASAAEPPASASASAAPTAEAPLPAVKVSNIGMHIGGGPNDDITKDPIRRSVHPHFDAFRRCFAQVEDASKAGDFGVDLRIDRAGGKAQVSHPRSALKGKEFKACVVRTFEAIDFFKPRGGTTTVSYSLRFTPG